MNPRFAVVGIVVADMARSLAFYRLLGVEVPPESDAQPHAEAELPGGLRIAWDTQDIMRSFDPTWVPPVGGTRMSVAFECASPAEVDRVYADVVAAGATGHVPPWDAVWRQRYAILHDPDGNSVDLFAPLG